MVKGRCPVRPWVRLFDYLFAREAVSITRCQRHFNHHREEMAAHFVQQQGRLLKNVTMGNTVSADFKIGDHILCYEPDTSKAKMLYEAKVI